MSTAIRVRFAPSPTGPLHIGGLRTALYNYLFAKKHGGTFVLRIEDTDQKRFVPGAEEYIKEALDWALIPYDEGPGKEGDYGPYHQSKRKEIYKKHVEQLLASGRAYYAFDTPEELEQLRQDFESQGKTFSYNWETRDQLNNSLHLSEEALQEKIASGEKYVIRFKSPINEELIMEDMVRGQIKINTNSVDDKVLYKSDGLPTYHMANIIDDHTMKISHVIRGEEWLPSMGLHVLLYRSFGWDTPQFAHLPLILKPTGKGKLSKRDGDKLGFPVFPLEWKDPKSGAPSSGYREDGYLPEAVINMLAFLGWNPGQGSEKEFFSLEELIHAFSFEHVSKSGARFDFDKTKWFQHHYFQQLDTARIAEDFKVLLKSKSINPSDDFVLKVINSIKERVSFVKDLWETGYFYFQAPTDFNEKAKSKAWKSDSPQIMNEVKSLLQATEDFSRTNLENQIKSWIKKEGMGFGKVMMPLRLLLVGDMQGPDLFEILEILGKEESISRINYAVNHL